MKKLIFTKSRIAMPLVLFLLCSHTVYAQAQDETFGDGVAAYSLQDFNKAREIWARLADQGNSQALFRLADLYARGLGGEKDPVRASEYFCRAGEKGHAESLYLCGKSKKEAGGSGIQEYIQSANLGFRKAQFYLANFYASGDSVEINYTEAYRLYSLVKDKNETDELGKLSKKMMELIKPYLNK